MNETTKKLLRLITGGKAACSPCMGANVVRRRI